MRSIAVPFVVRAPSGARIRTRLRLTTADETVVRTVGEHLGRLASRDLAWRCRMGSGPDERACRKRGLTKESSSRWAGAITRTSNDQWKRAYANLLDRRNTLRRASRIIQTRLVVPVGERHGEVRGYRTQAERFAKQSRLQHLLAELDEIEVRLAARRPSVCRGGRRLFKLSCELNRDGAKLTAAQWRAQWQAVRLFLTADGEALKLWGNETIRVDPGEHWLELRLPNSLAHLSNTPGRAVTYRLSCPVVFHHRADDWAAQVATGPVRYDISYDPVKGRWYLDASWRLPIVNPPSLEQLNGHRTLGIDLNADHLAAWVIDPSGNPVGVPTTIPLDLDGHAATIRGGRLCAAISASIRLAKDNGCHSITVENLNFADARQTGRETFGRGRRGKRLRRIIAGMPTGAFRNLLVSMAANQGLWVIAVDPGWTSVWGQRYWQVPLRSSTKSSTTVTRHHAAAVVIGRRGLRCRARRRPGVAGHDRRIVAGELPVRPGLVSGVARYRDHQEANEQRDQPRKTPPAEWSRFRSPGNPRPFGIAGAGPSPAINKRNGLGHPWGEDLRAVQT